MGTMRREEQIAEAEEMLGDSLNKRGFVKSLYFGNYAPETLPQYPTAALHDLATKKNGRRAPRVLPIVNRPRGY